MNVDVVVTSTGIVIDAIVAQGLAGDPGVIVSTTAPDDHTKVWVDISGL